MNQAGMNQAGMNEAVTDQAVADEAVTSSDNGFRYSLDVRFFEVDSLGVVFNMWYLGWCDEAMSAFMDSIGYGYASLRAEGFDAVLRKAEIEWFDSLQAFQQAEVAVRVEQVGTTSFRLGYDIRRIDIERDEADGEAGQPGRSGDLRTRCAHAGITYVCVEISDRGKVPIPTGLRERLVQDHA